MKNLKWILLSLFVLLIIFTPLITRADDDREWRGTVASRPDGSLVGTWVVGGKSFEVSDKTKIKEEKGPLDPGACASVKYFERDGQNLATRLQSEEAKKCGEAQREQEKQKEENKKREDNNNEENNNDNTNDNTGDNGNDNTGGGDNGNDNTGDNTNDNTGGGDNGGQPPAGQSQYVLIGWNDLGMHCMDPSFEDFSVLPPYNTLWAQVIRRGTEPQIVTQGVTVEYSFIDNSESASKTNFWDYEDKLFGIDLPLNVGLKGFGLTGEMEPKGDHFAAEGIPLTEYRDSAPTTPYPYQLAELVAKDSAGNVLATTQTVAPVSTEMNCQNCHNDNGRANPSIAMPTLKQNILTLHDQKEGTHLMDQRPVLCAGCHGSNALGTPGQAGVPNLSLAMHSKHRQIDDFTMEGTCYQCHPGPTTKCLRGAMAQEGMTCQDCHGNMADVANPARRPWLDEPRCGDCHEGHAENAGKLYRFSTGHGGVYCQACHGSQHAIYPTNQPNDNIQSILLQGEAGTIEKCRVCHTNTPNGEGPHGEGAESSVRGQSAPTAGDVNNDGVIDILDMVSISASFGSSNTTADLNSDGVVDIYDVLAAANNYLAP